MKYVLSVLSVLCGLLITPAVHAEQYTAAWSSQTTSLAVLASLAAIDYDQSAGWVTPGGGAPEINPILGEHPTRADMFAFGAAGIGLVYLATEILPEPWATIVVDSAISTERLNVEWNAELKSGLHPRVDAMPIIVTVRF